MTSLEARQQLIQELVSAGTDLRAASLAIGRSHSYLQQFVKYGKPRYLGERDRELLVTLYGVSGAPLEPPLKELDATGKSVTVIASPPPRPGDPIQDAREATIVHTWRQLPKEDQDLVIGILNGALSARGLTTVAA